MITNKIKNEIKKQLNTIFKECDKRNIKSWYHPMYIGSGAFRTVYKITVNNIDYAVKVGKDYDDENINELKFYNRIKRNHPSLKNYLLPILGTFKHKTDGLVLITPFLKINCVENIKNLSVFNRTRLKVIKMFIDDVHKFNIGMYNKYLVCLDYNIVDDMPEAIPHAKEYHKKISNKFKNQYRKVSA